MSLLERIDLIRYKPELYYKRDHYYRSDCGGWATIISTILLAFIVITSFLKYTVFLQPEIHTQYDSQPLDDPISLERLNFTWIVRVVDQRNSPLSDKYIVPSAYIVKRNINFTLIETEIPLKICSSGDLDSSVKALNGIYYELDIESAAFKSAALSPNAPTRDKSSLLIRYKRCQTSTCHTIDDTNDQLKNAQLSLLYLDTNVQVGAAQEIKKSVKELRIKLMSQYSRSMRLVVNQVEVRDRRNIVSFADYETRESFSALKYFNYDLFESSDGTVAEVTMEIDSLKMIQTRQYVTILEIFSEIGGFCQIISIGIICLVIPVVRKQYFLELSKETDLKQRYLSSFLKKDMESVEKLSHSAYFRLDPYIDTGKHK